MEQKNQYMQGFNSGYFLAKFEPGLLSKLLNQLTPVGDYLEGFFSGKEQFELEYTHKQINELDQLRKNFEDRDKGLEL